MIPMSELAAVLPGVLPAGREIPVADFSDTPGWLSLIKALGVIVYLLLQVLIVIWFERRVIGRMQWRPGPNRFGPIGIFQTLADGLKLVTKEDFTPAKADKFMYTLAPIISGTLCWFSFSVIPLGPEVTMFGHHTPLQLMDTPVAVLIVLAVAGVGAYGILLAGWSSGSTFSLLGGLRSSAQVISYEIAMALAIVAVILHSGTLSTSGIVSGQNELWYIAPAFLSFVIFVITMVGETNRLPFDLAEGEGELVGGFHTEYASMKFGMFYLGEYINMFTVSALATTLFLGGWQAPWPIGAINDGMFNTGWWPLIWFTVKMWTFIFFFVWLRGTLPRIRYDQFMKFGWKVMIPVTLVWVLFVAFMRGAQLGFFGEGQTLPLVVIFSVTLGIAIAAAFLLDTRAEKKAKRREAERTPAPEIDPFAGGYPVPPMPGQKLAEPRPALTPAAPIVQRSGATVTDTRPGNGPTTETEADRG